MASEWLVSDLKFDENQSKLRSLLVENECAVRDKDGFLYIPTQFCSEFSGDDGAKEGVDELLNGATDLIPNQYEGGFKIWEGLLDIANYLKENPSFLEGFTGKDNVNVLDVGCGSGLLGIFLTQTLSEHSQRSTVYLQDFNKSVIETFTIPNVILNESFDFHGEPKSQEDVEECYRFLYGDWSNITDTLKANGTKFQVVVSAETVYSEDNYEKLARLFSDLLADDGKVLIGAKSHYFGVGGGSYSFMDYIEANHTDLKCQIVHETGDSLLRHIILLEKNTQS